LCIIISIFIAWSRIIYYLLLSCPLRPLGHIVKCVSIKKSHFPEDRSDQGSDSVTHKEFLIVKNTCYSIGFFMVRNSLWVETGFLAKNYFLNIVHKPKRMQYFYESQKSEHLGKTFLLLFCFFLTFRAFLLFFVLFLLFFVLFLPYLLFLLFLPFWCFFHFIK
jgi:hypothetical protein